MRRWGVFALVLWPVSVAGTPVSFSEQAVFGVHGHTFRARSEVTASLWSGLYEVSARANAFRYPEAFPGIASEYSIGFKKVLYHVSVAGRLGTKPPNTERAAYRFAVGEARLTFYGLTLGPELPELSATVWESSGPIMAAESLDRTWVSSLRGRFTTTNHHLERPTRLLTIVQNTTQLEFRETWKERTSVAIQLGMNDYDQTITGNSVRVYLDNVEYLGSAFAIRGWPNNAVSVGLWQWLDPHWRFIGGMTRLHLLDGGTEVLSMLRFQWSPWNTLRVGSGYAVRRRLGVGGGEGLILDISYRW